MEVQHAIYVTLLHSLWMGLVLAFATGIVVVATKKSTAVMRYNLLTTLLFAFVIGIGFVFYQSLTDKTDVINQIETITAGQLNEQGIKGQSTMAGTSIITDITFVLNLWSTYSNQIVLIWFLIICAKCIQLMIGLHSIYYLKHNKVFVAGKFWENKVAELSQKLSINRQVRILQSGIAKVPMIAGYFKPVILIPIGMLNGISTAEVEAILSHELAHLKRNDYLVNILQSMIEIVFFFNPGVLWISKLIREEREHCCDDLALSCTESKHLYIKALIACQEFRTSHTPYAMAITGKRNQLKERVSRMLFDNNSTLNKMEKTILTITLISALIVTAAFNATDHKTPVKENGTALVNNTIDANGQPFSKLSGFDAGPGDRRGDKYTEVRQDTSKKSQRTKSTVATKTTATTKVSTTTKVNKDIEQQQKTVDLKIKQSITSEKEKARMAADRKRYNIDKIPVAPGAPKAPGAPTAPAAPKAPKAPPLSNAPQAPRPPQPPRAPKAPVAPEVPDMTADMIKDGLVKDSQNYSSKLNIDEFTVNGVKQPDAIHKKYVRLYLKNKQATITTTVKSD